MTLTNVYDDQARSMAEIWQIRSIFQPEVAVDAGTGEF
jgi:hypothetical protein